MKKNRIIIIGRNYTSRLGMIRAIGKCGYRVHVIRTVRKLDKGGKVLKDIDAYSKYVEGYYNALGGNRENLIAVLKQLHEPSAGKDIIIPVDDFAASTIDEYLDELKDSFLFPHIGMKAGGINKLMNKNVQKVIAKEHNLNVAQGVILEVHNGKYTLPQDIVYPCFPKPLISFKGNKQCMTRCSNEAELVNAIDKVLHTNKNCPFEIEEYIEIAEEYATLGFSDGENVVIPAMIRLLRDGSGSHKGVTLQGEVLPVDDYENYLVSVRDFIKAIGFVGLFDVDSYFSNGKMYFNELNLRFGASGYAVTASGVNLPEMFLNYLMKSQSQGAANKVTSHKIFLNEKVALDEYDGGYIDRSEYKKLLSDADIRFIKSDSDMKPYKYFERKVQYTIFKRLVKSLINKRR